MLSANILTILALFSSSTLSAPTRTHCQCKIVSSTDSTSPPPALNTPSTDHWTPANPSSDEPMSPIINDICTSLASQLEKFRITDPELYDLYMRGASPSSISSLAQKPIPTSVLLSGSSNQEAMHDYSPETPQTESKEEEKRRIVCFSSPGSSFSSSQPTTPLNAFHASPLALCFLQLIVLFSILACLVEGLHLLRTFIQTYTSASSTSSSPRSLRLTGSEQRLLAIPTESYPQDAMCCSPGAEKKLRAYQDAPVRYFASSKGSRREFIAYDDDSDDEVNRPVM